MRVLKKIFPPNFVDLMTHLVIHLIGEFELCGPVHNQWMYPIEHAMKDLKGYDLNMAKRKGYVAKGYIIDEALGLCIE